MSCGSAGAAQKVNVEKKGSYVYWFAYTDPLGKPQITEPERFKGKSAEVDITELGTAPKDAKLYVMNKKTANMAILPFTVPTDPKAAKPIDIEEDAFQYVRSVKLRIISSDKAPLETAVVDLTDGESTEMRALVTPADEGIASFENVAAGEIAVKVKAKGATKTVDSDFELPTKRDTPGFEKDIKVAGDVDTLDAPKDQRNGVAAGKHGKAEREEKSGGIGVILQMLGGLILVVVIVLIVWVVLKSKGMTAEKALRNMGVQLPQDAQADSGVPAAPAAPAVDPSICPFCGQRKNEAGSCACTVSPGVSPFAPPPAASAGIPRMVGTQGTYAGHIFEIHSASVVMGREGTNEIALPNDTTASRRHATVSNSGGEFTIRDEGSSNGTFVNGARITSQRLMPGDEVQVGGTRFRFEV